ncbi:hypothetical protein [Sorangium cellulosum]|nr:hypothetical protein [Sorangium cellulosum]
MTRWIPEPWAAGDDPVAAFRRRFAERYWSGAPLPEGLVARGLLEQAI